MPTTDIIELPITPDEAAKLVMSAGLIQPEGAAALAAMARDAAAAARLPAPGRNGGLNAEALTAAAGASGNAREFVLSGAAELERAARESIARR